MENLPPNQEGQQNKVEKVQDFNNKLKSIIDRSLTVENIDTYADDALNDLISLTDKVTEEYTSHHPEVNLSKKEIEDKAFEEFKLQDIASVLDTSQQKIEQLNNIDKYIATSISQVDEVITPPDSRESPILPGEKTYEAPAVVPRLKTLLYILESDFGVDLESVSLTQGIVTGGMLRSLSYVTVEIPQLSRVVQVCDEEGNASYVFDATEMVKVNINTNDINRMTKEEKNDLVHQNPRIGRRIIQTSRWRSNMSECLTIPFEAEVSDASEQPKIQESHTGDEKRVSRSELDPWRGFWTDPETQKHWGNVGSIARKIGLSFKLIQDAADEQHLEKRQVVNLNNQESEAYCVEDILEIPIIQTYLNAPEVSLEGEWEGFYTDEQGIHWGTVTKLAQKINKSVPFVDRMVKKFGLSSHPIKNQRHQIKDGYSYEDLLSQEEVRSIINTPEVENEGEWKGFYVQSENKHFGLASEIFVKLGVARTSLDEFIRKHDIETLPVVDTTGKLRTAYLYEDIKKFRGEISTDEIRVDTTGENAGFHIDQEGNKWATIATIADQLDIGDSFLRNYIKEKKYKSIRGLDVVNKIANLYSFDQLANNAEIKELASLPRTETEGEWKNFYIDESNKHWGSIRQIEPKIGKAQNFIENLVKRYNLTSRKILDTAGKQVNAYCYEEIINLPEAQLLNETFEVESEGEWKNFHIDEQGRHWGSVNQIVEKVPVALPKLEEIITRGDLPSIRVGKLSSVAYCYEDVIKLPEISAKADKPIAIKEGEWKGFALVEGKYYGPLKTIAEKSGLSPSLIKRYITETPSVQILDSVGRIREGYDYEAIVNNPKITEFTKLPLIEEHTDYPYYQDEEGTKWVTTVTLNKITGRDVKTIRKTAVDKNLPTIKARSPKEVEVEAYRLQDFVK